MDTLEKQKILHYKDYLNTTDLMEYLGIGKNTALEFMKRYGFKVGKAYIIDKETVKYKIKDFINREDMQEEDFFNNILAIKK